METRIQSEAGAGRNWPDVPFVLDSFANTTFVFDMTLLIHIHSIANTAEMCPEFV